MYLILELEGIYHCTVFGDGGWGMEWHRIGKMDWQAVGSVRLHVCRYIFLLSYFRLLFAFLLLLQNALAEGDGAEEMVSWSHVL